MLIFNDRSQPFGLLSNHAHTPIIIDSVQWNTITEYIYINLFTDPEYKAKIKPILFPTPFPAMKNLLNTLLAKRFIQHIEYATKQKLEQYDILRDKFVGYDNIEIFYSEDVDTFNYLIPIFSEYLGNNEPIKMSKVQQNKIIQGVSKALINGEKIANDTPFEDLIKYEVQYAVDINYNDPAFDNLHVIIPYLKAKIKNIDADAKYKKDLEIFKTKLFNVAINEFIKKTWPNLKYTEYESAKKEQFIKDPLKVDELINLIYNLYVDDKLDINDVSYKQIGKPPTEPLLILEKIGNKTLTIDENDPVLPLSKRHPVFIDGKTHNSVFIYAYYKLAKDFNIDADDITANPVNEMSNAMTFAIARYIFLNLTKHMFTALKKKFTSYETLVHLLLLTKNDNLEWNDETDLILGNKGNNVVGKDLMLIRNEFASSTIRVNPVSYNYRLVYDDIRVIVNRPMKDYIHGKCSVASDVKTCSAYSQAYTANIFFKQWVQARFIELSRVAYLFKDPSLKDLQDLYGFPISKHVFSVYPPKNDILQIHPADVKAIRDVVTMPNDWIGIFWRFIDAQLYPFFTMDENTCLIYATSLQKTFLNMYPNKTDATRCNKFLTEFYNKHVDNINSMSELDFVSNILTGNNAPTDSINDVFIKSPRMKIIYWSKMSDLPADDLTD